MMASAVILVAGFYFAREVLVPFAISFLLAFLLSPLVTRIHKLGLPRILAVIVAMILAVGVAAALVWVVFGQVQDIVKKLPQYEANLQEKFSGIRRQVDRATKTVTEIAEKGMESRKSDSPPPQPVSITDTTPSFKRFAEPVGYVLDLLGGIA